MNDRLRGIYVIVNEDGRAVEIAEAALGAGVRIVQYRAKTGIVADTVRRLRELTHQRKALLIMNDDWRAALEFDCDGVHLGPDDAGFSHVTHVREALGKRIIGLSCGTVEELMSSRAERLADAQLRDRDNLYDYIGTGPVYATSSKNDAGEPIGLAGLKRVLAATELPVCAIGGINATNIREVKATGAATAAVISAVANVADPAAAARELVDAWSSA